MPKVRIIEEVPHVDSYRWFVSHVGSLHEKDVRRKFFYNRRESFDPPRFLYLDDAKVWCADHGLHWEVERFELP
jgi:hypothetical protein